MSVCSMHVCTYVRVTTGSSLVLGILSRETLFATGRCGSLQVSFDGAWEKVAGSPSSRLSRQPDGENKAVGRAAVSFTRLAPRKQHRFQRRVPGGRPDPPRVQPPVGVEDRAVAANQIASGGGLARLRGGHLLREPSQVLFRSGEKRTSGILLKYGVERRQRRGLFLCQMA